MPLVRRNPNQRALRPVASLERSTPFWRLLDQANARRTPKRPPVKIAEAPNSPVTSLHS
jgi:hypothetical protein